MRILLTALMTTAACASASAAGVFNCRSGKGDATITVDAVFGYGKDSPLSSIKTKVTVNSPKAAPALRSSTMWIGR